MVNPIEGLDAFTRCSDLDGGECNAATCSCVGGVDLHIEENLCDGRPVTPRGQTKHGLENCVQWCRNLQGCRFVSQTALGWCQPFSVCFERTASGVYEADHPHPRYQPEPSYTTYKLKETCQDTDISLAGNQPFVCAADTVPTNDEVLSPSQANCCTTESKVARDAFRSARLHKKTVCPGKRGSVECADAKDALEAARQTRISVCKTTKDFTKAEKRTACKGKGKKDSDQCAAAKALLQAARPCETTEVLTGLCYNGDGEVGYAGITKPATKEECITMLEDAPRAVGMSYDTDNSQCRVLYSNMLGVIEDSDGVPNYECHKRKKWTMAIRSVLAATRFDATLADVPLQLVGEAHPKGGYCANSLGNSNYEGETVPASKSACFQMFADAPLAVGMYYHHRTSTCRVLFDTNEIGAITQPKLDHDYECFKRVAPVGGRLRRLRGKEELPV